MQGRVLPICVLQLSLFFRILFSVIAISCSVLSLSSTCDFANVTTSVKHLPFSVATHRPAKLKFSSVGRSRASFACGHGFDEQAGEYLHWRSSKLQCSKADSTLVLAGPSAVPSNESLPFCQVLPKWFDQQAGDYLHWRSSKLQCSKADSTLGTSQAVPHPSTIRALSRLTSEVRRDPVYSTRYGRQRKTFSRTSK